MPFPRVTRPATGQESVSGRPRRRTVVSLSEHHDCSQNGQEREYDKNVSNDKNGRQLNLEEHQMFGWFKRRREQKPTYTSGFALGMMTGVPLSPTYGVSTGAILGAALHEDPSPSSDTSSPAPDTSSSSDSSSSNDSPSFSDGGSSPSSSD